MHCFPFLPLIVYTIVSPPGWRRGSITALRQGEEAGFIHRKGTSFQKASRSLLSLEKKEVGEEGDESFYFLLPYIPTTSFRFSKQKLEICIILSLPEA